MLRSLITASHWAADKNSNELSQGKRGEGACSQGRITGEGQSNACPIIGAIVKSQSVNGLVRIAETSLHEFTADHIASWLQRLGRLAKRQDDLQSHAQHMRDKILLAALEVKELDGFDCHGIACMLCALATMKLKSGQEKLLQQLYRAAWEKTNRFRCQELAETLWALAKLKAYQNQLKLVQRLCMSAQFQLEINAEEFNCQDVVNLLWALAEMKLDQPELLQALVSLAKSKAEDFTCQHISTIMWSLATLKSRQPESRIVESKETKSLLHFLSRLALLSIDEFGCQSIANTLWALAMMNIKQPMLVHELCRVALAQCTDFAPQDIAIILWSLATLKVVQSELVQQLFRIADTKSGTFTPHDQEVISWALGLLVNVDRREARTTRMPFLSRNQGSSPPRDRHIGVIGSHQRGRRTRHRSRTRNEDNGFQLPGIHQDMADGRAVRASTFLPPSEVSWAYITHS
eukprot:TRINITY_DN56962_c0_g1_i1.p1 TRINITY_DN56962_c0_g1~~TRINITY_DN56962_c0_g1_i1.p1  ORF type:complete len:462 (+),score=59.17 TRINITY_DN56962_c0_g1_i1:70-1455(+)